MQCAQGQPRYLHVRDNAVLNTLIIELFQQQSITFAFVQCNSELSHQLKQLLGEVLIQVGFESGCVEYVLERAQAGFLFKEFAAVSDV